MPPCSPTTATMSADRPENCASVDMTSSRTLSRVSRRMPTAPLQTRKTLVRRRRFLLQVRRLFSRIFLADLRLPRLHLPIPRPPVASPYAAPPLPRPHPPVPTPPAVPRTVCARSSACTPGARPSGVDTASLVCSVGPNSFPGHRPAEVPVARYCCTRTRTRSPLARAEARNLHSPRAPPTPMKRTLGLGYSHGLLFVDDDDDQGSGAVLLAAPCPRIRLACHGCVHPCSPPPVLTPGPSVAESTVDAIDLPYPLPLPPRISVYPKLCRPHPARLHSQPSLVPLFPVSPLSSYSSIVRSVTAFSPALCSVPRCRPTKWVHTPHEAPYVLGALLGVRFASIALIDVLCAVTAPVPGYDSPPSHSGPKSSRHSILRRVCTSPLPVYAYTMYSGDVSPPHAWLAASVREAYVGPILTEQDHQRNGQ
ncbi:hypothetical protein HYPSUDRAFT_220270 [Hypholoma sublateritium FD-334 SS-4]|uniref:Uncharacterized protein n=1 Tax=Hypholoma sublateritium (strain FD-334 SS-4) TaxID=945553 RepID=A0A0D2N6Z3_HYPSF|nr:hypothetical protein HYPSUDRAFT_220270 [Hypholoma sublateritium FD-334 SS-4]